MLIRLTPLVPMLFLAWPCAAQTYTSSSIDHLFDATCSSKYFTAPPCTQIDNRTVTAIDQTITNVGGTPMISGDYNVALNGSTVYEDGFALSLQASYVGHLSSQPLVPPNTPVDPSVSAFTSFTDEKAQILSVSGEATLYYPGGAGLASLHVTGIQGNAATVGGTFSNVSMVSASYQPAALEYGVVTGTLTVTPNNTVYATPTTAPFYTRLDTTATVTTKLDETGLTTPTISVSDGIQMNGSRVTGLGAGVDPTDAVNKAQLDAEAMTRATADTQLAQAIGTEANTRATADTQLAQAIGTEANTRATADTQLAQAIGTEAGTRAAADTQLVQAIGTEANTRAAADTQLGRAIDTEAGTRAAVDTQLAQGLASETSARIAADVNLSSRLDGLSSRVDALNGRIDKVQRRADAGTAVAVAMGGAVFLPDMHFNLTANVATYGGAHAGAVQVGAVVSRHVAFNAGVATGFNRGGQTAGRAGFTVGW
jgi:hypothetical protein